MCIRDSIKNRGVAEVFFIVCDGLKGLPDSVAGVFPAAIVQTCICLLYTSDAADERSSVDLGGRRIIKKKKEVKDGDRRETSKNRIRGREVTREEWQRG